MRKLRRSPEVELVLLCLKEHSARGRQDLIDTLPRVNDWSLVCKLASAHRISPLIVRALAGEDTAPLVPQAALNALRSDVMAKVVTTLSLGCGLEEALLGLEARDVPVLLLKGPVVADLLYADPALRPYTDIDILVPADRTIEADAVFRDLGYAVEEDHGGHEGPHGGTAEHPLETLYVRSWPPGRLDVHFDHLQIGLRPNELSGLWDRSRPWRHHGGLAKAPALADLFLMLAVHLHRHGFNRLIWFKDLDLFLRKHGQSLDWAWVGRKASAEGVSLSLNLALRRVHSLLGAPIPAEARRLMRITPAVVLSSLLWPEAGLFDVHGRPSRWRRAVQFVPWEGIRGATPSLLLMGRRADKLRALWRRGRSAVWRASTS
jgi:hypothetical protein